MYTPACGRVQYIPGSRRDIFRSRTRGSARREDVTSVGTGVVEDVHTTEAGMDTFRANAEAMEGKVLTCEAGMDTFRADAKDINRVVTLTCEASTSDAATERQPEVPDGVAITPDEPMDQSGKRVVELFRDRLWIGRVLVKQTGASSRLIIGGVTERSEESTPPRVRQISYGWRQLLRKQAI
jgi:hypothetical protein